MSSLNELRSTTSGDSNPSSTDNPSRTENHRQTVSTAQNNPSQPSTTSASGNLTNLASHTISIPPELFPPLRSPIISHGCFVQQSDSNHSSSQIESQSKQAGPLPEKVGEIGYVPPPEPMVAPNTRTSDPSTQGQVILPSSPPSVHSVSLNPGWSPAPASVSSQYGHTRRRNIKPRQRINALHMFLRPTLLVLFGAIVITLTIIGFIEIQHRMIHKSSHPNSASDGVDKVTEDVTGDTDNDSPDGKSTHNVSFVYMGTVFIIALVIEIWVFISALRRFYHRLGLWVDQEYPIELPDLSDPEAPLPASPALPLWAKILLIKPQAVRPPPLPSYMAVLNVMRTGGRSEVNPEVTGDVEDGEVIRTLAIGQGHAAPAFDGEEFQRSTIILSGPPKRNSISSASTSIQPNQLLRSLSRSLTGRFYSSRNSANSTNLREEINSAFNNHNSNTGNNDQNQSSAENYNSSSNQPLRETFSNDGSTRMIEASDAPRGQIPAFINNTKPMTQIRR